MVRRSVGFLLTRTFAVGLGLIAATGCAQAQEEARAQEADDDAQRLLYTLRGGGSYLGVYLSDVDAEAVEELQLSQERGAIVSRVSDDGPAEKAGIEVNDVIVSWNGDEVQSVAELSRVVRETPAGRTVEIGLIRDGSRRQVEVTLEERGGFGYAYGIGPRAEAGALRAWEHAQDEMRHRNFGIQNLLLGRPRLGISLQNLTPQLAGYFGVEEGALITSVEEDSPAADAGLQAGDVLVGIDGESVEDPGDATRLIFEHDEGEVELKVVRDRKERTLKATLPEPEQGQWKGPGPAIYISPGRTSFQLDLPETIVAPRVVIPEVLEVTPPALQQQPIRIVPPVPTPPVQEVSWEQFQTTAL